MTKIIFCLCLFLPAFFFLGPQSASANSAKCDEALRDSDLFVRDVRLGCENLRQCLVRRDTCVADGLPNTQSKCESVDECMGSRDGDFADSAQCRYQWKKFDSGYRCSLKRKFFAAQDLCPGRVLAGMGLIGIVLLQGQVIDYSVDSKFNCEAINSYFKNSIKNLEKAREKVVKFCEQGTERAQAFATPACAESRDFKSKSDGQYALPAGVSNGTHVRDGRDGSGSGHEGGGEESGGGGGPKVQTH